MLRILRQVILQGTTLDDAARILVDVMGGGKRASQAVQTVRAELDPGAASHSRWVHRKRPALARRQWGPLPEVQCSAAQCKQFLVVPIDAPDLAPEAHLFREGSTCKHLKPARPQARRVLRALAFVARATDRATFRRPRTIRSVTGTCKALATTWLARRMMSTRTLMWIRGPEFCAVGTSDTT
jgi:hypothetical protein